MSAAENGSLATKGGSFRRLAQEFLSSVTTEMMNFRFDGLPIYELV